MGCYASTTLFGGNGTHRKNGPPCPQMGHEPFLCARSVSPLAPSRRGIYVQSGIPPGVAHHAADAMSRLPHEAVPSDPIEEEIPVCAVAPEESQEPEFPTALEEVTSDPITEIPILHMDDLFESQCLDPTARRNGAARVHDPTWDYYRHGILARRTPSGETDVYLPHTLRLHGPHAIIIPVAGDGSDLRRGDTDTSIANSPDKRSDPECDPSGFRILTRVPRPTRERDTYVGLASLLEPNSDDRIPVAP
jgi:hypothetical protein